MPERGRFGTHVPVEEPSTGIKSGHTAIYSITSSASSKNESRTDRPSAMGHCKSSFRRRWPRKRDYCLLKCMSLLLADSGQFRCTRVCLLLDDIVAKVEN